MKEMELIEEQTSMEDVKKLGRVIELLPEQLWVVQRIGLKGYDELQFLTFRSCSSDGSDLEVDPLFLIKGFSEHLREGRHTYFPDKGYIFYMNSAIMKEALNYCEKHFDMN